MKRSKVTGYEGQNQCQPTRRPITKPSLFAVELNSVGEVPAPPSSISPQGSSSGMGGRRQKHLWVKAPATETKHLPHHPPTPETASSRRAQALYPSAPQPPSPELTAPRPFLQPPPRPPPPPAPGRPGSGKRRGGKQHLPY